MSELRSPAYWIGHMLATVATIVGVYYAAVVGFDVAVELEMVSADRRAYFVSESLYKELEFNTANMDSYIEKVKGKPHVYVEHIEGIRLNDFVFEASKEAESTFMIEPSILTQVSIYYFAVGNALDHYYDSGRSSPQSLMNVVKKETAKLKEQKTLERLSAYNAALADSVEERGLAIDRPDF